MSSKFSIQTFLHQFDWYAKPVSLTYNQQKEFKTIPGCVCTFISFLLLSFFIMTNIVKYSDPEYYVFFRSTNRSLIDLTAPPTYTMSIDQYNLFTSLSSTNATVAANLDAFYGGVYIQQTQSPATNALTYEYIFPVPCTTAYAGYNLTTEQSLYIQGLYCPAVNNVSLRLNSLKEGSSQYTINQTSFAYIVKSCPGLNVIRFETGLPLVQCASNADIQLAATMVDVAVVTMSQFFNIHKYETSTGPSHNKFEWEVLHYGTIMTLNTGIVKTYQISQNTIHLKDSWLYNWPFYDGLVLNTYEMVGSDVSEVSVSNEMFNTQVGYLNYRLVQYPIQNTDSYTREGISEVISLIGGFVGMMKNFSYFILGAYQTFTIDKSMIKKVLSLRKSKKGRKHIGSNNQNEDFDQKQEDLKTTINNRSVFSASFLSIRAEMCRLWLQSCFCCCKRKQSKELRHFQVATKKLYNEIDLLEVVKSVRVARFLSSLYMTNNQKELVKFSRSYCINPPKSERQEEAVHNVLSSFKPDTNEIDRKLYDCVVDKATQDRDDSSDENMNVTMMHNQMDLQDYFVDWAEDEHEEEEKAQDQFDMLNQANSFEGRKSQMKRRETLKVDYEVDAFESSFSQLPLINHSLPDDQYMPPEE